MADNGYDFIKFLFYLQTNEESDFSNCSTSLMGSNEMGIVEFKKKQQILSQKRLQLKNVKLRKKKKCDTNESNRRSSNLKQEDIDSEEVDEPIPDTYLACYNIDKLPECLQGLKIYQYDGFIRYR